MWPAVAFKKLGSPQGSCARLPLALCALTKRLNRPRDAKRSSSAAIVSRRAAGFAAASIRGVAAPLLSLASSLPQHIARLRPRGALLFLIPAMRVSAAAVAVDELCMTQSCILCATSVPAGLDNLLLTP